MPMFVFYAFLIYVATGIRVALSVAWRLMLVGGTRIMIEHAAQFMAVMAIRLGYHLVRAGFVVHSIRYVHKNRTIHLVLKEWVGRGSQQTRQLCHYSIKMVKSAKDVVKPQVADKIVPLGRGEHVVDKAVTAGGRFVGTPGAQQGFPITMKPLGGAPLSPRLMQTVQQTAVEVGQTGAPKAAVDRAIALVGRGSIDAKGFALLPGMF